jgi:cystathionine beta-lyase/cystathionine gamma-synthase
MERGGVRRSVGLEDRRELVEDLRTAFEQI